MKTLEDVLEEIAPEPDPGFVADMEWRLQQGFPRSEQARKRRLPRLALPDLRPRAWAAAAASALLALAVTASLLGSDAERRVGGGDMPLIEPATPAQSTGARVAEDATSAQGGATPEIAPIPPPPGQDDIAPGARNRRVERSAQLSLAADPNDFDDLADSIFRAADRHDGFVLRSSFSQTDGPVSSGFFELRVPANELQRTLNELSRLATVRARSESGNDVTAAFVSLRDRLRTAQAERKSLLRRLELAVTETAANAIRRRLRIVGRQITSLSTQVRAARERTEFATVFVDLVDEDAGASSGETDEAVEDAVGSLEDILNFLIRAMGILVPIALAAALVGLVASYARRRARERALA